MGETPAPCRGFVDLEHNGFFHFIKGFPVVAACPNGREELPGDEWGKMNNDIDNMSGLAIRYETFRPGQRLHDGPASAIQNVNSQKGRLMRCSSLESDFEEEY